ncbi:MAG TPA: hypothetical protein VMY39_04115, partial [Planctomycetota bacterium]|nr:hypothetical protein [Planctomycetota bacterium]
MKRTGVTGLVVVLLATLAVAWPAFAATTTRTRTDRKPKDEESSKTTTYIVVQMKDMQGKVSFEAIPSKSFSERQKRMHEEYTQAVKEWEQAKAKARKEKAGFTDAKPLAPSMTRVGSTVFRDQDKAREAATKLQEKYEALQEQKK